MTRDVDCSQLQEIELTGARGIMMLSISGWYVGKAKSPTQS